MGRQSWPQLQHWWASHGQMCHFSCLAEKLKWSFPPALNFMVCCSIIKKSIKLPLMEAGPESCLYLCHPRQVLAAVPECRRAVERSQLTNGIFCYRNQLTAWQQLCFPLWPLMAGLCFILIRPDEGLSGLYYLQKWVTITLWLLFCSEDRNSINIGSYNRGSTKWPVDFSVQSLSGSQIWGR